MSWDQAGPSGIRRITNVVSTAENSSDNTSSDELGHTTPVELPKKRGRPCKGKRGRPKTSSLSRTEQINIATQRYHQAHPESHRAAVNLYSQAHPEIHREAVERYFEENPDVNRENVARFRKDLNNRVKEYIQGYAGPPLTRDLILGNFPGEELVHIPPLRLKVKSLKSESVFKCRFCSAPLFEEEKSRKKWCCGGGVNVVNEIPPIDAPFYLDSYFLDHARPFNNLFAFSALGVSGGFQYPQGGGLSFVKIQGRVYHRVFDLSWRGEHNNMALYIEDPQERMRLARGLELSEEVTSDVLAYLREVNRLIQDLRNLHDHAHESAHLVFQRTSRTVDGPVLGDAPACNEIAGVIRTSAEYNPREVVVWKKGAARPHQVNYLSETYESLQYPLIFPHATCGWSPVLQDRQGRKLTQVRYYRLLLLSKPRFTFLRRLAQEYFVDMWCRAEEERLQFIKHNQKNVLRIASRRELDETIAAEGGIVAGKVYLPSSFTNSPRYMRLRYMDGMAIVSRKGKPSFFLTVTCNPSWEEIKSSLNPGEKHSDRPDLCVRVFHEKLRKLLIAVKNGILFGGLIYILYVIEFQKRGLPHAHIAFRVAGGGPMQSADIDSFVRATIPSREEANGRLRELVLQHMVHGPCGTDYPNAPCTDKDTGRCSKRFPRAENEVTHADRRGFMLYRRPCEESVRVRRNRSVTDSWIVPYNPAVLLLMECHCNLEVATGQRVIKYLFKYINKGPDRARVAIVEDQSRDEVDNYANLRYVSACEALWRILEYDISCREPAVVTLPIHLEQQDHVIFQPGQEIEALERSRSNLWLYLNRPSTPEMTPLTYLEFFEQFIVETVQKRGNEPFADGRHYLSKRQRGKCVARLRWLSPTLGEVFFLRMLLAKFPCSSYEGLRTVDGVVHPTFQEAAMARGLLDEETEFEHALQEASTFKTGRGLRQLFFAVIMFGAPAAILWERFKDSLSEDYLGNEESARVAHHRALCDIDHMLRPHGRCLRDLGLPEVEDVTTELGREAIRWDAEDAARSAEEWRPNLTEEQLAIADAVIDAVVTEDKEHNVFFIDGPSGTGKTVVLNYITSRLRSENAVVLCTASTGIAALNHEGGITAHSMFQLPLETNDPHASSGITGGSQRAELIRKASLIIWDEAPMAHKVTIEILDRSLRDICQDRQAFGGKVMVLAGDFRQIPPIIPDGSKADIIDASLKSSRLWPNIVKKKLETILRSREDQEYSAFVLAVGENKIQSVSIGIYRPIPLRNMSYATSLEDLINFVYPRDVLLNATQCCGRAILSGTNQNIAEINTAVMGMLPNDAVRLISADSTPCAGAEDNVHVHTDVLNNVSHAGVPDHILELKVGCVVILIRNISFTDRLVNGTKLIVEKITRKFVEARMPNRPDTVLIPRICFKFQVSNSGIEMIRRQFPLKVAYGVTINKSQGQTLDKVGIDLRSDVFSHGQLYVALGRVRRAEDVKVLVAEDRILDDCPHAANIVIEDLIK